MQCNGYGQVIASYWQAFHNLDIIKQLIGKITNIPNKTGVYFRKIVTSSLHTWPLKKQFLP